MRNRRGALIPGLLLIALGAWLLAGTLGVRLPSFETLWPVALIVFGLAFLVQFFAGGRQGDGLVFTGVAAALLGGFFLAITLGLLKWSDAGRLWPAYVLIGGLAFLAQWLARPKERGLLVPAVLALAVGGATLALTLGLVRAEVADPVIRLWPLALILLGLGLLGSYVMSGRRKE
jgi:cell wall-active antibiotic response 4TMS protein YvqF